jgi:hypothetical protein
MALIAKVVEQRGKVRRLQGNLQRLPFVEPRLMGDDEDGLEDEDGNCTEYPVAALLEKSVEQRANPWLLRRPN